MGASTMKATSVISGRLRHTEQTLGPLLYGGYTEVSRAATTSERFFSSLRSGLKTRACGGLDPLILCPFGPFVLTLVFSVRPPQSGVECGEVGCHRFRFE